MEQELTNLKLENYRLKEKVLALESVLKQQCESLRESTKLLQRLRPPRPAIPNDKRLQVAADQKWKCADPFGDCVLYQISDGTFDSNSLFEIDHVEPHHLSFRTAHNLAATCVTCHQKKTRLERLQELEERVAEEG